MRTTLSCNNPQDMAKYALWGTLTMLSLIKRYHIDFTYDEIYVLGRLEAVEMEHSSISISCEDEV